MDNNKENENVPDPGETNQKPEPNHISGRPYASKGHGESVEKPADDLSTFRNDKEPKRSSGWNDLPKENTRADAPQIGIE